ncbi:MAG: hypothetical protein GX045_00280 [Clostridiaceae bacterium]|jgi:hypothetical protein|nr:hypothetical protein [Clostridiaceae bacterium]
MNGVVTWNDLIKVVLFILGVGVLFYLLLAAIHLVGILKNINKMLDKNRESISNTLEQLPAITENVSKVSDIVREEMESLQKIVGNIGRISDSARETAEMLKNDIVVKAKNILDIIDWIKKLFSDKGGKKKEIVYNYKYKQGSDKVEETKVEETVIVNDEEQKGNKPDDSEEKINPDLTGEKEVEKEQEEEIIQE